MPTALVAVVFDQTCWFYLQIDPYNAQESAMSARPSWHQKARMKRIDLSHTMTNIPHRRSRTETDDFFRSKQILWHATRKWWSLAGSNR